MRVKEALENTSAKLIQSDPKNALWLRLKPGLSETELTEFAKTLPAPPPEDIRELLLFARGFKYRGFYEIDFCPKGRFGLEEVMPCGLTLATDDCGNEWVLDVRTDNGNWGPVLFMSHDPPVAVMQAPDLEVFIEQILSFNPKATGEALDLATKAAVDEIWTNDPYLVDVQFARNSADDVLTRFSKELPDTFCVADLRSREIGSGFTWWRRGREPRIKRYDSELIFGVESKIRKSFFDRLKSKA